MIEYDIRFRSLDNKVRHLEINMPQRETLSIVVFVKTGTRNELQKSEYGISHEVEHDRYTGSRKRSSVARGLVVDSFGPDESAYTEKEYTAFYLDTEASYARKAIPLLSEIFVNPTFPRGALKLEKNVIFLEISDYKDDYPNIVLEQFESVMYGGSEMGKTILGTKSALLGRSRKELMAYADKWYRGGNVMISLAGNTRGTRSLVEKYFSKLPSSPIADFQGSSEYGKPGQKVNYKDTYQAYFVYGVPGVAISDPDYYTMRVIEIILGGHQVLDGRSVQSSRIYDQVRSKRGMAYEVSTFTYSGSDSGYIAVQGTTRPNYLRPILDLIQGEMFGLADSVTSEEVARAKHFFRHYLVTQLENPRKTAELIGVPTLLLNKVVTPTEMFENIEKVNLRSVRNLAARIMLPNEGRLAVLGPFDENLRKVR